MQIITDETKKEIKAHGSHTFPLLVSYEKITAYDSGSFLWHWHPEIEMTLITSGEMLYRINHQEYHVKKGDAIFANANALHTGTMYQDQDCTYISITFDSRLLSGFEGSLIHSKYVKPLVNDLSLSSFCFNGSAPWHATITAAIQRIAWNYEEKADTYELTILMELYTILKTLHLHMRSEHRLSSCELLNYDRVRTILLFVEDNYDRELTLHEIADQIHVCKNECCRIFKSYMHQSLFEFILEFRIEKSIGFLMNGSYSVSEISQLSGFNDSNYFSRAFKKQKGCSPLQYRKKMKTQG